MRLQVHAQENRKDLRCKEDKDVGVACVGIEEKLYKLKIDSSSFHY